MNHYHLTDIIHILCRVWFDRMESPYNEALENLHKDTDQSRLFRDYIVKNKMFVITTIPPIIINVVSSTTSFSRPHYVASKRRQSSTTPVDLISSCSERSSSNDDIEHKQNKYRPVLITTTKTSTSYDKEKQRKFPDKTG